MSRYVDVDKLKVKWDWKDVLFCHGDSFEVFEAGVKKTIDTLKELPAINIVRCKDCKYYYHGRTQCEVHDSIGYEPNDYCSYGERREDE